MDFHQTRGGQQFLYGTMPKLVKEIARLADAAEYQPYDRFNQE